MSAYVNILQFNKTGRFYGGSTDNLSRRIRQHRSGTTQSTKRLGEFKLVFKQEFDDLSMARKAKRIIKSWKRRDFIEKIIRDGKILFTDEHP